MPYESNAGVTLSIFGESHGPGIGAVLEHLPAGEPVDEALIEAQLARRAPGLDPTATARKEPDKPEFLSGVLNGYTTGAPLAVLIRNTDTRSQHYDNIRACPRPSHADYAAAIKYGGYSDVRGGGHFSGRLTAPLVAAGSICRGILARRGVVVAGHVSQIGAVKDAALDPVAPDKELLARLSREYFSVIDPAAKQAMEQEIMAAKADCDSVGGAVELVADGLPAGLGDPMFQGVENVVASALYAVPAVKGVSFGAGFEFASLRGSEANDAMHYENGTVRTKTNHCGGILGGITNGMPLIIQVALKPTPSIGLEQQTVDLQSGKDATLKITGRHDPCIVPRALPALEAALCVALLDLMERAGK